MIDTIIEDSYQKKNITKRKIPLDEKEKSEVFNKIKNENLESSTLINNKVKNADITINSNIDNLLSYSVVDSNNRMLREKLFKFKKEIISSEPIIKTKRKKQTKYLFKGDFNLSEKMKKTKIREFSFLGKKNNYYYNYVKNKAIKNQNLKNKLEFNSY